MVASYDPVALASACCEVQQLLMAWQRATGPFVSPWVPDDMVPARPDPLLEDPSSGWQTWHLVPTRVSLADVAALNGLLPSPLPLSFVAFLTSYAFLPLDFGHDYGLPGLPTTDPLRELRTYAACVDLCAAGFVQVGVARGCGDPVCLDLERPASNGECPVVVFNHDFVPAQAWGDRDALLPYSAELRPSFLSFLRSIIDGDDDLFPPPLSAAELGATRGA